MSQVHSITHLPVHSTVFGSVIWFFTVRLVSMMPLKETRKRTMELPLATVRVQRAAARTRFRVSVNLLAVPGAGGQSLRRLSARSTRDHLNARCWTAPKSFRCLRERLRSAHL